MKKYLTIVIEYEGDTPPITGFGQQLLGCDVTGLALGNEIARSFELQEKIEESNGLCDELAQFIYSIEDLLDFNKERNELLLRYEQERR